MLLLRQWTSYFQHYSMAIGPARSHIAKEEEGKRKGKGDYSTVFFNSTPPLRIPQKTWPYPASPRSPAAPATGRDSSTKRAVTSCTLCYLVRGRRVAYIKLDIPLCIILQASPSLIPLRHISALTVSLLISNANNIQKTPQA